MLKHARQRDRLTVALCGELDHCSAAVIRAQLDELLADPAIRHLILDMDQLQFMDSSGIGVILGRYRILKSRGGSVCVTHMNQQITRIFRLSGMGQVIRILDQGQEAAK